MKRDILKRYVVAAAIAVIWLLIYFGAQYKYDLHHDSATRTQVILCTLLITAMEPPMYVWRSYASRVFYRQDIVYWVLLVVIIAVAMGLTYLLGFPLRMLFAA